MENISDTLVSFGSEIKTVEETATGWKFGGFLVVFDSHDVSRQRDKFTKSTDYDIEDGDRISLFYNHGLDGTIKRAKIGTGYLSIKDAGIWLEGEVRKRTDYLAQHAQKIGEGLGQRVAVKGQEHPLFGLSSGALSHLVDRVPVEGGHEIRMWKIGEASITPTPAEPLTGCFSLKSLAAFEAAHGSYSSSQNTHLQNLKDSLPDGLTFQAHSQQVLAANGELLERIESLADCRCVKSNRCWSAGKYGLLMETATDLNRVAETIKAIAHAHAPRHEPNLDASEILAQIELTRARLNGVDL